MKINFKVRFKNPVFIAQLVLSVLTPIVTYFGLNLSDLTSWAIFGNLLLKAISNPFVLGTIAVSVWNALNDPTTKGVSDSKRALDYNTPSGE